MTIYIVIAIVPYENGWIHAVYEKEADADKEASLMDEDPYVDYHVEDWVINGSS